MAETAGDAGKQRRQKLLQAAVQKTTNNSTAPISESVEAGMTSADDSVHDRDSDSDSAPGSSTTRKGYPLERVKGYPLERWLDT